MLKIQFNIYTYIKYLLCDEIQNNDDQYINNILLFKYRACNFFTKLLLPNNKLGYIISKTWIFHFCFNFFNGMVV
jgi:hypothetical protein